VVHDCSWGPPQDKGGRDVVDYEVSYIEMVKTEVLSKAKNEKRQKIQPQQVCFRIGRACTDYVIRNLTPETDYFDIMVSINF